MEDYKIKTDVLAPSDKISLEYSGFHPSRLMKTIPDMLKDCLKVEGADVFEFVLKWDVSGETISFFGEWHAKYAFDMFSTSVFKIQIQGSQSKKDRLGKVKITLKSALETKFKINTSIQASFVKLYFHLFYNNQRRKQLEESKILMHRIESEIRSLFNLIQKGG